MPGKHGVTHPEWWTDDVAAHDYEAALGYLCLRMGPHSRHADNLIGQLREDEVTTGRPNDILRAAGLPALPMTDPGVHRDLMRLLAGDKLSPVLLVSYGEHAEIADGYHRVSLMYLLDPFMHMPLKTA